MQRWACVVMLLCGCAAGGETLDEQGSGIGERVPDDARTEYIKGGTEATAYPQAVLIDMDGGASGYCSGSLIAPRLVLTAGHCAYGFGSFEVSAPYASPPQTATSSHGETYDWNSDGQYVDPKL